MKSLPGRCGPDEINQAVQTWLQEHCNRTEDGKYVCKTKSCPIMQTTAYISIHSNLFSGCAGGGECKTLGVPYCFECEGAVDAIYTCVHVFA